MMKFLDMVRKTLLGAMDFVSGLQMLEARVAHLEELSDVGEVVPNVKRREITTQMREEIFAAHAACANEREWLFEGGPRDQLCARHRITVNQIRGVLSSQTVADRKSASSEEGLSESVQESTPAADSAPDFAPDVQEMQEVEEPPVPFAAPAPEIAAETPAEQPAQDQGAASAGAADSDEGGSGKVVSITTGTGRGRRVVSESHRYAKLVTQLRKLDSTVRTITDDPTTWPRVDASEPLRQSKDLAPVDWAIAYAVAGSDSWQAKKADMLVLRRLEDFSLRGMKAVISRGGTPAILSKS